MDPRRPTSNSPATHTEAYHAAFRAAFARHDAAYKAWNADRDNAALGFEYDNATSVYLAMEPPTFAPVAPVATPAAVPVKVRTARERRPTPALVAVMAALVVLPAPGAVDAEALAEELNLSATTVRRSLREWREEADRRATKAIVLPVRRQHPEGQCLGAIDCEICWSRSHPVGSAA